MNIFVDTGVWIALADEKDQYHDIAKKLYVSIQNKNIPLFITDYIFDETVTWLHYKISHDVACHWGNKILNSHMVKIIKVSDDHVIQAWELFQKYHPPLDPADIKRILAEKKAGMITLYFSMRFFFLFSLFKRLYLALR